MGVREGPATEARTLSNSENMWASSRKPSFCACTIIAAVFASPSHTEAERVLGAASGGSGALRGPGAAVGPRVNGASSSSQRAVGMFSQALGGRGACLGGAGTGPAAEGKEVDLGALTHSP